MDYTQTQYPLSDVAIAMAIIAVTVWFLATIGQWLTDSTHTLLDLLKHHWRWLWRR